MEAETENKKRNKLQTIKDELRRILDIKLIIMVYFLCCITINIILAILSKNLLCILWDAVADLGWFLGFHGTPLWAGSITKKYC